MKSLVGGIMILSVNLTILGCSRHTGVYVSEYKAMSFDAESGKWVVIRTDNFDGEIKKKRLVLVCSFYRWGGREAFKGPSACALKVGESMVSNATDKRGPNDPYIEIDEFDDFIAFVEGLGDSQVRQHFDIVKQEVIEP